MAGFTDFSDRLKAIVPSPIRAEIRQAKTWLWRRRFAGKPAGGIFSEIYSKRLWGRVEGDDGFCSGEGSHDPVVVAPYVEACAAFLQALGKPDAVDLGCGDFAVGAQFRAHAGRYIAGDIVHPLIERNRRVYHDRDVDFRVVDMIADELPPGDVLFVRQVLQHLSNADIMPIVGKIARTYKYLVLSEHVPKQAGFTPNIDKPTGPDIRAYGSPPSGVVLTAAPFDLPVKDARILCEVEDRSQAVPAVVRTIAYTL